MSNSFGLGMAGSNGRSIDARSNLELEAAEKEGMKRWSKLYGEGVLIQDTPSLQAMQADHEEARAALIVAYQEARATYEGGKVYSEATEVALQEQYEAMEAKIAQNRSEFAEALATVARQEALAAAMAEEAAIFALEVGENGIGFEGDFEETEESENFPTPPTAAEQLKAARKAAKQAAKSAAIAARKGR